MPGHGARILLWSFDFEEINSLIERDNWDTAAEKFVKAAFWLQDAGADAIVICTNTIHKIAEKVADQVDVPLINLIDETAMQLNKLQRQRPLLVSDPASTVLTAGEECCCRRVRLASVELTFSEVVRQ